MKLNLECITFADTCFYNGEWYVSHTAYNGLFKINENFEISFLGHFENEPLGKARLHSEVIEINKTIYFMPATANGISAYDSDTGRIEYYSMKDLFDDEFDGYFTGQMVVYDGIIILFPYHFKYPIVSFDLETKQFEKRDDLTYLLKKELYSEKYVALAGCFLMGYILWCVLNRNDKIIAINLLNVAEYQIYKAKSGEIRGAACQGTVLWLKMDNGSIQKMDTSTGMFYTEYRANDLDLPREFTIVPLKEKLLIVPDCVMENGLYITILSKKNVKNIPILGNIQSLKKYRKTFRLWKCSMKNEVGKIFLCPVGVNKALIFEIATEKLFEYEIETDNVNIDLERMLYEKEHLKYPIEKPYYEDFEINLMVFLNNLLQQTKNQELSNMQRGAIGKKAYGTVFKRYLKG